MPVISSTATKPTTITDAAAAKQAYLPTHPGLFEVVYTEGSYNSRLVASRSYSKGEVICKVEGTTPGPKKYTSVQVSKEGHIELNSDRDSLTFFYPSSEWEMDQPFPCWCGDDKCVKQIQGAKFLSKEVLSRYWVASHIKDLLDERDAVAKTSVSA
ncbi:hypothetical protein DFQ27_004370 [Actinomortierella ambigua]|uniref:Post-SET domain-containing protein n=1 Tax=Actinomortierella ambigua TaxID=1343610 RepID=A0A9P6Q5K7_9FUNG|nr:hypothetical protein DFQ26_001932 [Actinomortierella ambigua]KAG0258940.1 hypothetical protein DFQ27_004370 [Actinomortierella ambigua]